MARGIPGEEEAIAKAVREGRASPELFREVQAKVKGLQDLKEWLNGRALTRAHLNDARRLARQARGRPARLAPRHPEYAAPEAPKSGRAIPADPRRYLEALRLRTAYIDIRGLQVGTGKAHRFSIEELYIPLSTVGVPESDP